ncbi:unnamed protein product [Strongylus vulgaris]|uniref:Uncharacterized protein n=1 Tax=Strongylus vulgaris TaxID=40348 RepID=A0A3P7JAB2_STRVU|nr:unnamed protein product [Strongylus vulgaris]
MSHPVSLEMKARTVFRHDSCPARGLVSIGDGLEATAAGRPRHRSATHVHALSPARPAPYIGRNKRAFRVIH